MSILPARSLSARIVAVSLLVGCCLVPMSASFADQADDDYDAAIDHYKKQRWKLAVKTFRAFDKAHPKDRRVPFVRLYLGISLENLEQYRDARTVLRAFVKDYPKNRSRPDALYRVGECSYFLNDLKAAEKELQAFVTGNPKHEFGEFALPYLGDAQYRLNKPKDAVKTFQLALTRYKTGRMAGDAKFGLAKSYAALKEIDKAAAQFRELAGQAGSTLAPEAQLELGSLYYESKDYKKAAKAFDAFETQFPKHNSLSRARLNGGFAHAAAGDHTAAVARFDSAAADKTLQPTARYWQGVSYRSLKQYDKAVGVLKAEFTRDAKSAVASEILLEWANCERLQNKHAEAGKRYLDYVQRWPKKPGADLALYYYGRNGAARQRHETGAGPGGPVPEGVFHQPALALPRHVAGPDSQCRKEQAGVRESRKTAGQCRQVSKRPPCADAGPLSPHALLSVAG